MKVATEKKNALPSRIQFLLFASAFEMAIGIAALIWARINNLPVAFIPSVASAAAGVAATIPLLILNGALYYFMVRQHEGSPFARFFKQVIVPLCQQQTIPSAVCIGIVSGFGEELFFRGALTEQLLTYCSFPLALITVNILFAYVHFIGAIATFGRVVFFYFLFGFYFSFLVEFKFDLFTAVVCHSFYNTIVILIVRQLFPVKSSHSTLI